MKDLIRQWQPCNVHKSAVWALKDGTAPTPAGGQKLPPNSLYTASAADLRKQREQHGNAKPNMLMSRPRSCGEGRSRLLVGVVSRPSHLLHGRLLRSWRLRHRRRRRRPPSPATSPEGGRTNPDPSAAFVHAAGAMSAAGITTCARARRGVGHHPGHIWSPRGGHRRHCWRRVTAGEQPVRSVEQLEEHLTILRRHRVEMPRQTLCAQFSEAVQSLTDPFAPIGA